MEVSYRRLFDALKGLEFRTSSYINISLLFNYDEFAHSPFPRWNYIKFASFKLLLWSLTVSQYTVTLRYCLQSFMIKSIFLTFFPYCCPPTLLNNRMAEHRIYSINVFLMCFLTTFKIHSSFLWPPATSILNSYSLMEYFWKATLQSHGIAEWLRIGRYCW